MQILILYILTGLFQNNYAVHNENPCLNYRTKTYQVVTNGIYVSKVDSIIANSKVEPLGSRTYENGKLISAYYLQIISLGCILKSNRSIIYTTIKAMF